MNRMESKKRPAPLISPAAGDVPSLPPQLSPGISNKRMKTQVWLKKNFEALGVGSLTNNNYTAAHGLPTLAAGLLQQKGQVGNNEDNESKDSDSEPESPRDETCTGAAGAPGDQAHFHPGAPTGFKPRRNSQKSSSSRYRGVCWLKKRRAWRARIEVQGKREHLGYFFSEERAARAYDARALELNGPNARLNFPLKGSGADNNNNNNNNNASAEQPFAPLQTLFNVADQPSFKNSSSANTSSPLSALIKLQNSSPSLSPSPSPSSSSPLSASAHALFGLPSPVNKPASPQFAVNSGNSFQASIDSVLLNQAKKHVVPIAQLNQWAFVRNPDASNPGLGGLYPSETAAHAAAYVYLKSLGTTMPDTLKPVEFGLIPRTTLTPTSRAIHSSLMSLLSPRNQQGN